MIIARALPSSHLRFILDLQLHFSKLRPSSLYQEILDVFFNEQYLDETSPSGDDNDDTDKESEHSGQAEDPEPHHAILSSQLGLF